MPESTKHAKEIKEKEWKCYSAINRAPFNCVN
jgi:hypothetical protein